MEDLNCKSFEKVIYIFQEKEIIKNQDIIVKIGKTERKTSYINEKTKS
ncbi:MAG: hypothetical protein CH104c_0365 [Candidatus Woesebacteria bacterium]|nr:MAG: hypothetical protein CH104c_0365 [Candidatus Woesebacteria bacterium]